MDMNMMTVNYQFEKKGFGWAWLLVNIIGISVGVIIGFCLSIAWEKYGTFLPRWFGYPFLDDPINATLLDGILVGNLLSGWGEQILIKRYTHLKFRWFLGPAIGIGLGAVFCTLSGMLQIFFHEFDINGNPYFFWGGLVLFSDFLIGVIQWLAIRKIISRSGTWIFMRILSSFCFLSLLFPIVILSVISAVTIYDSENNIYYFLKPFTMQNDEIYIILTYSFLFFSLLIPATLSAVMRGLFIKNRLKKSAQKMDLSQVVQVPNNDQPPIVPGQ